MELAGFLICSEPIYVAIPYCYTSASRVQTHTNAENSLNEATAVDSEKTKYCN